MKNIHFLFCFICAMICAIEVYQDGKHALAWLALSIVYGVWHLHLQLMDIKEKIKSRNE